MAAKEGMTKEADARIHREIEDALTFLLLCERGFGVGDMAFFDGATPGFASVIDSILHEAGLKKAGDGRLGHLADSVPRIRGAVILGGGDVGMQCVPCGAVELDLVAKHKLAARSRGSLKFRRDPEPAGGFSPFRLEGNEYIYEKINPLERIVEVRTIGIAASGEATRISRNHMIRHRNGGWYPLHAVRRLEHNEGRHYEQLAFTFGAGMARVAALWWRVLIRFHGRKPGISLFTDAVGIKDFFRFRDLPEGQERRAALLHWVTEHWRQNRRDPAVENYVREHLRGAREFDWHGLTGTIELPPPEVDREARAVEGRKRLRRDELDRRLRAARRAGT